MTGIRLTPRELETLHGMAGGQSNGEIGRALFVSEDTVKTHARRLFAKLEARDRAHAVAIGYRLGLLALPGEPAPEPEPERPTAADEALERLHRALAAWSAGRSRIPVARQATALHTMIVRAVEPLREPT